MEQFVDFVTDPQCVILCTFVFGAAFGFLVSSFFTLCDYIIQILHRFYDSRKIKKDNKSNDEMFFVFCRPLGRHERYYD